MRKQNDQVPEQMSTPEPSIPHAERSVLIIHSYGHQMKIEVAQLLETLQWQPIVLQEQWSPGRTPIEKLEANINVVFAVILLSPDNEMAITKMAVVQLGGFGGDLLKQLDAPERRWRARQNIVFEWGYCTAKLGRKQVAVIYEKGVELPTEMDDVLCMLYDEQGDWRLKLAQGMKAAGLDVDLSLLQGSGAERADV